MQGIWNLEVHAIFSSNSGVSSIPSDKQGSISNEYASYDLGIDMMPRTTAEDSTHSLDQNICANNEVGIANVSTNVEQQHLGSSDSNKVFTNYNNNNNNNHYVDINKGRKSLGYRGSGATAVSLQSELSIE